MPACRETAPPGPTEDVTALSGRRIELGADPAPPKAAAHVMKSPCCQQPMALRGPIKAQPQFWFISELQPQPRGPPPPPP